MNTEQKLFLAKQTLECSRIEYRNLWKTLIDNNLIQSGIEARDTSSYIEEIIKILES